MKLFSPFTLNLRGRLLEVNRPQVMGIVNATPDSFYSGSRTMVADDIRRRVEQMIVDGVDMIDVGAYSSRSGADVVSPDEEMRRLDVALGVIGELKGDIPVSVDTFRAGVARRCVLELGADIINDISGGTLDPDMFAAVADLHAPYILMHMRGNPSTMQSLCDYDEGVTYGVIKELSGKVAALEEAGVADIIIDPGFGFSKTLEQNYQLAAGLPFIIEAFRKPVLVGISRKSMLTRLLGISPAEALEATVALDMALMSLGAAIVRVHDVKAARQSVTIAAQLAKFTD